MSLFIAVNQTDKTMVNLYSHGSKGKVILWAVMHEDALSEIGISKEELDALEESGNVELVIKP